MYHIKINICEKNFLPKNGFVIKTKCLYILKLGGGGGEVELRMWWDFSGEHVASSNPCSF